MKFSTLEELKVRQWDVFGRLFESVRRQVGQNWPVQDSRGFIFSVPKTLPDNLIQRGVMALSERTHVLARLSWVWAPFVKVSYAPQKTMASSGRITHWRSAAWR